MGVRRVLSPFKSLLLTALSGHVNLHLILPN